MPMNLSFKVKFNGYDLTFNTENVNESLNIFDLNLHF